MRWLTRGTLGVLVACTMLAGGCAQERAPIDRVQANALDKHFFVGPDLENYATAPEFFWRNFVTNATASDSLIGIGSFSGVDRIVWQITEDTLFARRAYQIAPGEDNLGLPPGTPTSNNTLVKTADGTVVAAFKILSHFDIIHDYNTQTGEDLNVIVENTTDRPWNEREFMRVDWSQNLVNTPDWSDMFLGQLFGGITITPVSYYVSDPASDDAPHLDEQAGYFDVTSKFLIAPALTQSPFSDIQGMVPTCMVYGLYTGSAVYDCDPQEATVLQSFWRIDPSQHDFERLENTLSPLDVVGNPGGLGASGWIGVVTPGQQGWDPQYGFTDALYHRFANLHNVWQASHQSAPCNTNIDSDKNGTADQCEAKYTHYKGSSGSQCDVYAGQCTIPYRDRTIKPVAYWINQDAPSELLDPVNAQGQPQSRGSIEDLAYTWNQALTVAVAYGREVECRRTGGARDACHAQLFSSTDDPATKQMVSYGGFLTDVPRDPSPVLTFCHNPVRSYDLQGVCGTTGTTARVGDIRKNFVFYWPYASRAMYGGIGSWQADPLTGEIIGAAATIMGRSATTAAAMQRDYLQVAMGDINISDIVKGAPATTYARMLQNGRAPQAESLADLQQHLNAINLNNAVTLLDPQPLPGASTLGNQMAMAMLQAQSTTDLTMTSTALLQFDALAGHLEGSTYEAQLVSPDWLIDAFAVDPNTPIDNSLLSTVSPLRGLDPGKLRVFEELADAGLEAHGMCFNDSDLPPYGSPFMSSLATYFKNKYPGSDPVARGNAMYDELWKEAVKGIGLHEIGHSLGMLHNFASSYDSLNYKPQYWQLRTNEGTATASCNGAPRSGATDTCMGPRYIDPLTPDEQGRADESRPSIEYFGNTSTMEYTIERGLETTGLGLFDMMSMGAFYGRVLETFDPNLHTATNQATFKLKNWSQLQDRDLLLVGEADFFHYTTTARLAKVFDPQRDCRPATDAEKAIAKWRVVHGKVCAPQPRDHWAWQDFQSGSLGIGGTAEAAYWHVQTTDGHDNVRWPYRWGVQVNSYIHVNASDAGADAYEVAQNFSDLYDATYPWTYFRRQNRDYQYTQIPSRTANRYFESARALHWNIADYLANDQPTQAQLQSDDNFRPYIEAENVIFNRLARSLLTPEPGPFYDPYADSVAASRQPIDTTRPIFDTDPYNSNPPSFTIDVSDGRYIEPQYSQVLGGSWDYLDWVMNAGYTVEKLRAIEALVDSRPVLYTLSRNTFLDGRTVELNFRTDMPDAVDRLIGGILSEDWETIAPYIVPGNANPSVQPFDIATPGVRPAGADILFPNIGYDQEVGVALLTSLFSRLNADLTLVDKMRVWIDGQVGGVNIPDAEQVRFTDPVTSYAYVAHRYGTQIIDGKTVESGIASRMILHANAMLAGAYQVVLDAHGNPVLDAYGAPTLVLDGNGQPQVQLAGNQWVGSLRSYVGLLDAVREMEYLLDYGPGAVPTGGK